MVRTGAAELVEEVVLVVFGLTAVYCTPPTVITAGEEVVPGVVLSAEVDMIEPVVLVVGDARLETELGCACDVVDDMD